jgi:hypothetical protein
MPVVTTGFQKSGFQLSGFQIVGTIPPPPVPPTLPNDLNQLDHGVQYQMVRAYLGPSLGWVDTYVTPSKIYTAPTTITLGSTDSLVLVNTASATTVNLPDVVAWVQEPHYRIHSPFARFIVIKDLSGGASLPIAIVPFGLQVIDGALSVSITAAFGFLELLPRPDYAGWIIANPH